MREITADQLKQGYRIQRVSFSAVPYKCEDEDEIIPKSMTIERREYNVIGITELGTYIVEDPHG